MPRLFEGTPITVGTVSGYNAEGGPIIEAFPNYNWQQAPNCAGFTSVFRVFVSSFCSK